MVDALITAILHHRRPHSLVTFPIEGIASEVVTVHPEFLYDVSNNYPLSIGGLGSVLFGQSCLRC
ncbi:hypothetical protein CCP3SC1_130004 [Gammaproteobacteria bacterium]